MSRQASDQGKTLACGSKEIVEGLGITKNQASAEVDAEIIERLEVATEVARTRNTRGKVPA